jgi:hypothetical protein
MASFAVGLDVLAISECTLVEYIGLLPLSSPRQKVKYDRSMKYFQSVKYDQSVVTSRSTHVRPVECNAIMCQCRGVLSCMHQHRLSVIVDGGDGSHLSCRSPVRGRADVE